MPSSCVHCQTLGLDIPSRHHPAICVLGVQGPGQNPLCPGPFPRHNSLRCRTVALRRALEPPRNRHVRVSSPPACDTASVPDYPFRAKLCYDNITNDFASQTPVRQNLFKLALKLEHAFPNQCVELVLTKLRPTLNTDPYIYQFLHKRVHPTKLIFTNGCYELSLLLAMHLLSCPRTALQLMASTNSGVERDMYAFLYSYCTKLQNSIWPKDQSYFIDDVLNQLAQSPSFSVITADPAQSSIELDHLSTSASDVFVNIKVFAFRLPEKPNMVRSFPFQFRSLGNAQYRLVGGVFRQGSSMKEGYMAVTRKDDGRYECRIKQTDVVVDECRVSEFCHHQDTSKPEVFFTPLTCTPSGFARTKSCRR